MKIKVPFLAILLLGSVLSCHEKVVEPATDTQTNQWIYDQMKYWYYWNEHITAQPDMSKRPEDLFESLLYRYDAVARPDGDRFSWIQESAEELEASLSGESKTSGMEFKLVYNPTDKTSVLGIVLYTISGSPAAMAGFKRGDIFTSVNNQKLTADNYSQLLSSEGTLTYTLASIDQEGIISEGTIKRDVTPVILQEDPVYFDTVYNYGSDKIGYLVYHQFVPQPNNGGTEKQYDKELDAVFASFKSQNVNALILDLRYNPGGYVSSATNLASLIVKATPNDVFFYKEYNKDVTKTNLKEYGESYFYDKFTAKSQNIGADLNHTIILTSSRSASASELVINGLKPFMNVTLIGGKTVGKNVGSVTLKDTKNGIKWGLQPIVSKSLNSKHESNYYTGFVPDFEVSEGNILYPYGNPKDPLLGDALFRITGMHVTRQMPLRTMGGAESQEIIYSIEKKAGGSNMFY